MNPQIVVNETNEDDDHLLTMDTLCPAVKKLKYAVRGPISYRAAELKKQLLSAGNHELPFDCVIVANIGDCHATGQKPLTFIRQLLAVCTYPELLKDDKFPEDVKLRARRILDECGGNSVGSYTEAAGLEVIRKDVAQFIMDRDEGVPCDPEEIFLTTGASGAIQTIMKLLANGSDKKPSGFMIPIPQYPLYSASLDEFGCEKIGYYLDEDKNWALSIAELERAYNESLDRCEPRAICIINPGNPTGQVLSKENIVDIIKWAYEKRLFIFADEVYQENVYVEGLKFHSVKKIAYQLGRPYSKMEIASFYSTAKGYMGECGLRGGYVETFNMLPEIRMEIKKITSPRSCSSVIGQACMDAVVNPPRPGEPSYDLFIKEKNQVLSELKEKADLMSKLFNSIEGVKCNPVQGAMYAFPRVSIPQRAIEHARANSMEPDMFYCLELLESTGICVVPGSGFHQLPGTFHFRTTILPPVEQIRSYIQKFRRFHLDFNNKWK